MKHKPMIWFNRIGKQCRLMAGLLLLLFIEARAQRWQTTGDDRIQQPIALRGAFLGSVIYPGFKLGLERPLVVNEYRRKRSSRPFFRERNVGANLSLYHHPDYHTNWMLTVEYVRRHVGGRGFFTELVPGIGLSRTILGGTTYRIDDSGQVSQVAGAGNTYFMPSLGVGLGQDFSRNQTPRPVKLYTRLTLLALYPYNGALHPRPTIEVGVLYTGIPFLNGATRHRAHQRL